MKRRKKRRYIRRQSKAKEANKYLCSEKEVKEQRKWYFVLILSNVGWGSVRTLSWGDIENEHISLSTGTTCFWPITLLVRWFFYLIVVYTSFSVNMEPGVPVFLSAENNGFCAYLRHGMPSSSCWTYLFDLPPLVALLLIRSTINAAVLSSSPPSWRYREAWKRLEMSVTRERLLHVFFCSQHGTRPKHTSTLPVGSQSLEIRGSHASSLPFRETLRTRRGDWGAVHFACMCCFFPSLMVWACALVQGVCAPAMRCW